VELLTVLTGSKTKIHVI